MSRLTVLGIGADGIGGLGQRARQILSTAPVVHGSQRQLDLARPGCPQARLVPLPRPLLPALPALARQAFAGGEVILASGDPMFFGIGTSLVRELGADAVEVVPAPSSLSLTAARLGWAQDTITACTILTRPAAAVLSAAHPGARLLVLCPDAAAPAAIGQELAAAGLGRTRCHVLWDLGGPGEGAAKFAASELAGMGERSSWEWTDLCVVAVDCTGLAPTDFRHGTASALPGLADAAYDSDGQLTKYVPRMLAVSLLRPYPGAQLWDVGGGSGSIGIEWLRAAPRTSAHCFEAVAVRRERIARNAAALGVPRLQVHGAAPSGFAAAAGSPDAVFVGGGLTTPELVDQAWERLRPGGRFVATAVTRESEEVLHRLHSGHGGQIFRTGIETLGQLGDFTAWEPARNLVFYAVDKDVDAEGGGRRR